VSESTQGSRETHHLSLHSAGNREAVRTEHPDAETLTIPVHQTINLSTSIAAVSLPTARCYGRGMVSVDSSINRPPALSVVATPGKRTQILELAAEAERLGFSSIACPTLGNALGLCTSLAHVTERIRFYTSIQGIYGTSPAEIGSLASHIHEVSGGRFALGLGVSHEVMVRRLGVTMGPPLGDMRAFVDELHGLEKWSGPLPPIFLATLRDRMLALAVEIASGALWANASLRYTSRQVAHLVGRGGFHLANMIPTVIDDDVDAAAAVNEKTMQTYLRLPNYRNYWKAAGWIEQMEAAEAAASDPARPPIPVDRAWLADCTAFGPAAAVLERFSEWRAAGVEPIAVMSSTSGGQAHAIRQLFDLYR